MRRSRMSPLSIGTAFLFVYAGVLARCSARSAEVAALTSGSRALDMPGEIPDLQIVSAEVHGQDGKHDVIPAQSDQRIRHPDISLTHLLSKFRAPPQHLAEMKYLDHRSAAEVAPNGDTLFASTDYVEGGAQQQDAAQQDTKSNLGPNTARNPEQDRTSVMKQALNDDLYARDRITAEDPSGKLQPGRESTHRGFDQNLNEEKIPVQEVGENSGRDERMAPSTEDAISKLPAKYAQRWRREMRANHVAFQDLQNQEQNLFHHPQLPTFQPIPETTPGIALGQLPSKAVVLDLKGVKPKQLEGSSAVKKPARAIASQEVEREPAKVYVSLVRPNGQAAHHDFVDITHEKQRSTRGSSQVQASELSAGTSDPKSPPNCVTGACTSEKEGSQQPPKRGATETLDLKNEKIIQNEVPSQYPSPKIKSDPKDVGKKKYHHSEPIPDPGKFIKIKHDERKTTQNQPPVNNMQFSSNEASKSEKLEQIKTDVQSTNSGIKQQMAAADSLDELDKVAHLINPGSTNIHAVTATRHTSTSSGDHSVQVPGGDQTSVQPSVHRKPQELPKGDVATSRDQNHHHFGKGNQPVAHGDLNQLSKGNVASQVQNTQHEGNKLPVTQRYNHGSPTQVSKGEVADAAYDPSAAKKPSREYKQSTQQQLMPSSQQGQQILMPGPNGPALMASTPESKRSGENSVTEKIQKMVLSHKSSGISVHERQPNSGEMQPAGTAQAVQQVSNLSQSNIQEPKEANKIHKENKPQPMMQSSGSAEAEIPQAQQQKPAVADPRQNENVKPVHKENDEGIVSGGMQPVGNGRAAEIHEHSTQSVGAVPQEPTDLDSRRGEEKANPVIEKTQSSGTAQNDISQAEKNSVRPVPEQPEKISKIEAENKSKVVQAGSHAGIISVNHGSEPQVINIEIDEPPSQMPKEAPAIAQPSQPANTNPAVKVKAAPTSVTSQGSVQNEHRIESAAGSGPSRAQEPSKAHKESFTSRQEGTAGGNSSLAVPGVGETLVELEKPVRPSSSAQESPDSSPVVSNQQPAGSGDHVKQQQEAETLKQNLQTAVNFQLVEKAIIKLKTAQTSKNVTPKHCEPISQPIDEDEEDEGDLDDQPRVIQREQVAEGRTNQALKLSKLRLGKPVVFSVHGYNRTVGGDAASPFERDPRLLYNVVDISLGGGYDTSSGVFHAPVDGFYAFALVFSMSYQHLKAPVSLTIVHNDVNVVGHAQMNNRREGTTSTFTRVMLKAGDRIETRLKGGDPSLCTRVSKSMTPSRYRDQCYLRFYGQLLGSTELVS